VSADKLSLYNDALTLCGERMLADLTEQRESRRLLDAAWAFGAVDFCLETGQWNFAVNSIQLDYSPSIEPTWGYRRAFDKPADYIRTMAVCTDEYFRNPLLRYVDEASFWFSDLDTMYIRYVSNLPEYGMNLGKWPGSFSEMVSSYLAMQVVTKLTQDTSKWKIVQEYYKDVRKEAKSNDAMNEPTKFAPKGSWIRARQRNRSGAIDDRGFLNGDLTES
jgi:hypothetical protein